MPPRNKDKTQGETKKRGKKKSDEKQKEKEEKQGRLKNDVEKLVEETTPKLEDAILKAEELNCLSREAMIGVARFDIVGNRERLKFGTWNPRAVKEEEVNKLVESFLQHGLNRFDYSNAIPLCVLPGVVKSNSYMPMDEFLKQDPSFSNTKLPILEFTDSMRAVLAAGGAHRLSALNKYLTRNMELLVDIERHLQNEDDGNPETRRSKKSRDEIAGVLAYKGQWLVIIYDLNKVQADDGKLGLHISANQRHYNYRESAEEGLVQLYQLMVATHQTWRDMHAPQGSRPTLNQGKQYQLLSQDYVSKLFGHLMHPSTSHYIHSPVFKLKKLHSDLISPYGGLLSVLFMDMEDKLRMCFNDVVLDNAEVERVIESMSREDDDDAWKMGTKSREDMMSMLRSAPTVFEVIGDNLRAILDQA
ncbi:hypothetical protein HYDPIDRAFT_34474, partial [Hydnomerulius pinastri MD-312]